MLIIDLNDDLSETRPDRRTAEEVYDSTIPPKVKERAWRNKEEPKERFFSATFGDDRDLYHSNYSDYLVACYRTHQSIVITPDIFWHTILCEIAAAVAEKSEFYEPLFTATPGKKQRILIATDDVTALPLPDLIAELTRRVPSNTAAFIPEFSTTTTEALFVRYAAFADICSPYYSYGTFCCGIPKIKVLGEPSDYLKIIDQCGQLIDIFATVNDTVLTAYLGEKIIPLMQEFIEAVADQNKEFFNHILTTKRCGSGSQYEVFGWWPSRMYVKSYSKQMPHNLPSHVARVTWDNTTAQREFSLNGGLLSSKLEDGFMVPQWEFVTNEICK